VESTERGATPPISPAPPQRVTGSTSKHDPTDHHREPATAPVGSDVRRARDGSRGTLAARHRGAVPTPRHTPRTVVPSDGPPDRRRMFPSECRSTRDGWGSSRRSPSRIRRRTTSHRRPVASTFAASPAPPRSGTCLGPGAPAPMLRPRFAAGIACSGSSLRVRAARSLRSGPRHSCSRRRAGISWHVDSGRAGPRSPSPVRLATKFLPCPPLRATYTPRSATVRGGPERFRAAASSTPTAKRRRATEPGGTPRSASRSGAGVEPTERGATTPHRS